MDLVLMGATGNSAVGTTVVMVSLTYIGSISDKTVAGGSTGAILDRTVGGSTVAMGAMVDVEATSSAGATAAAGAKVGMVADSSMASSIVR